MEQTLLTARDYWLLEKCETPKRIEDIQNIQGYETQFPSHKTFYRRIKQLVDAKHLHVVGSHGTKGRPKQIVCTHKIKAGIHEVELGLWLDTLPVSWEWGGAYQADATLFDCLYVEWDRNTETMQQLMARIRRYPRDAAILMIVPDENRMDRVLERCGIPFCMTKDEAMRHGEVVNYRREKKPLNKVFQILMELSKNPGENE